MHQSESASDATHASDPLSPGAGAVLLDRAAFHGKVVIERFTPHDDMVEGRPLEVMHSILAVRRDLRVSSADRDAMIADFEAELADMRVGLEVVPNLITQVGDQYYGERASGIGGAPGQVTGMRLGTGSTAVAKTGAGAAIVTYKSGSYKAIDGGYPASSLNGSSRQIQWKTSWGAGVVNGSALAEVVITNESPLSDVSGSASNTISRALFGPMTLGASDTLAITWNHLLLGA